MSNYPAAFDAFASPQPGSPRNNPSLSGSVRALGDAVEAIQAVLGLSPAGASATVSARCAAIETSTSARVTGPASATDNAVARFDATTGKLLRNSGVIVDDSNNVSGVGTLGCGAITSSGTVSGSGLAGSLLSSANPVINGTAAPGTSAIPSRQDHVHASDTTRAALAGATFTGDLTISKAGPTLAVSASSGDAAFNLSRPAGNYLSMRMQTAGVKRWVWGVGAGAESGSNAGSDFYLNRCADGGGESNFLAASRATGRMTFYDVGATAGLELGTSGPRDMAGTGSPEGVVTAPVGSTWRDTAGTTGAIRWIKASGTGNTGWVVDYGDTGWRNLTAAGLSNGWTTTSFRLRRAGNLVQVAGWFTKTAATAEAVYAFPSGFRCTPVDVYGMAGTTSAADDMAEWYVIAANHFLGIKYPAMTGATVYVFGSWFTTDAWPATLPGT